LSWLSEEYNWFGKNQHGFRPGLSTEIAMHELKNTVEGNVNKKIFTTVAFLDVSGAFDYTWPIAVLAALGKKKCPLYLLKIIESLFYNRTAILETERSSYTCKVPIGYPQGGVLSPFLWIILAEKKINSTFSFPFIIIGYADDIAIISMHRFLEIAIQNLEIMCSEIVTKCENFLLEINPLKSIFMIFSKKNVIDNSTIKIKDNQIKPVNTTRFVGFELDSKLNCKSHITSKCQATQRLIHALGKCLPLTWGIDTVKLLTLYKAIIIPKILYGVSVWCHSTLKKYVTKTLMAVQRTMLKLITRSFKSVPTTSMLILAILLPINLTALELSYTRKLYFTNLAFTPSSLKAIGKVLPETKIQTPQDYPRKYFSPNHPSWSTSKLDFVNAPSPLPLLPSDSETLYIHIGVSKTEAVTGVAIVFCLQKEGVYTQTESLSCNTTTIQDELHGLHLALKYC
jgi:hypothetical protein